MRNLSFFITIVFYTLVYAAVGKNFTIAGKVHKFDKNFVVVENKGQKINIPKSYFVQSDLVLGKVVELKITDEQLKELIHDKSLHN